MGFYSAPRRHISYQAYLAQMGAAPEEISALMGGETTVDQRPSVMASIGVGVATGALTYVVTKFLERMFK